MNMRAKQYNHYLDITEQAGTQYERQVLLDSRLANRLKLLDPTPVLDPLRIPCGPAVTRMIRLAGRLPPPISIGAFTGGNASAGQRLRQIGEEIIDILDADGKPDQPIADASVLALGRRH